MSKANIFAVAVIVIVLVGGGAALYKLDTLQTRHRPGRPHQQRQRPEYFSQDGIRLTAKSYESFVTAERLPSRKLNRA
jgi:hypothetical protein